MSYYYPYPPWVPYHMDLCPQAGYTSAPFGETFASKNELRGDATLANDHKTHKNNTTIYNYLLTAQLT